MEGLASLFPAEAGALSWQGTKGRQNSRKNLEPGYRHYQAGRDGSRCISVCSWRDSRATLCMLLDTALGRCLERRRPSGANGGAAGALA